MAAESSSSISTIHRGLWGTIREAVRGAEGRDFTDGPIGTALLLLAVPMVLEVALESVFAVVNVFWVTRIGPEAVAVVGLTEAMLSIIYALGMGLGIGATAIVAVFTRDVVVAGYAVTALRVVSLGFPFYAYGMVLSSAFNGAGDTRTPTVINVFCFWLFEIPLAYLLARPAGLGPLGAFIAIAVAFSGLALVSAVLFRRGRWKSKLV